MSTTIDLPSEFILPRYDGGCFSDLPGFIRSLLLPDATSNLQVNGLAAMQQRPRTVIVVLIDAFGWSFFERFADHPFLRRFVVDGSVNKLTSQFPSTTAAHITTLYTGLPVGQHGIFEWRLYEPLVDGMIQPLLFSWSGETKPETLRTTNLKAEDFIPDVSLAEQLSEGGVPTLVFQHASYAHSSYSEAITRGATSFAYKTAPEVLATLRGRLVTPLRLPPQRGERLEQNLVTLPPPRGEKLGQNLVTLPPPRGEMEGGDCFYLLYLGDVDTVCHDHGPNSPQLEAQVLSYLDDLERWMQGVLAERLRDALLLVTADHGQGPVDPATTLYLNHAPAFDRLQPLLRTNRQRHLLIPGGSCRDLFVYAREEAVDEVQAGLQRIVQDRAVVCRVADLIEAGAFGPLPVSQAFLQRVGNLVILPYAGEAVWWYEKDRFEQTFYGNHGGLTAEEMEIPLLLLPLA